jgi:hypothetical protein
MIKNWLFGHWSLEFIWNLKFGDWNLAEPKPIPIQYESGNKLTALRDLNQCTLISDIWKREN